jgi:hypothetical protein
MKSTKKIITALDDVIHIDDSDDDVQYMGTTTAPQRAPPTSTRYNNIGGHIPQQQIEDIGDHFTT